MSKYDHIIERVFIKNYVDGNIKVPFDRDELAQACVTTQAEVRVIEDYPRTS